jgi:outer membrane protein assembly factor BamB
MRRLVVLGLAGLALSGAQCRSPTIVRVTTRSEVDCAKRARVALVVARDVPSLQGTLASAFSTTCTPTADGNNDNGSVVLAPVDEQDAVAFALMTRPDGESPETCLDPAHASACIVARRQLKLAAHSTIEIPIELRLSCLGVACPPSQTCRKGECVDATLAPSCSGCDEGELGTSSAPACGDVGELQPGAPWPMAGYCPTRPGRSGRLGPASPNVRWRFKTGGIATMSPAVAADGTIYVGSNDHVVYAIDRSGRERWRAGVPNNINETGFVIGRDGGVFVGCADGKVYAYDQNGGARWATSIEADVAFTPVVTGDGTIVAGGFDRDKAAPLFGLRLDGTVKWRNGGSFGVSAVAIGLDGSLFVGGADSALHALRAADGTERWAAPMSGAPRSPSVGHDGTVYVTAGNALEAIDPGTGAPRWTFPIDAPSYGISLGRDDTIYVAQENDTLLAVRPNGTLKWRFVAPGNVWTRSATIGGDGTAYLGGTDGALYAITEDGALSWKAATGGRIASQPALGGDGTLYVVSSDSYLYAIGP